METHCPQRKNGTVLQNCENCGAVNSANARTCYVCVSPLKPPQTESDSQRRYSSFPDEVSPEAEAAPDTGTLLAQDLMRGLERAAQTPRRPRRSAPAGSAAVIAAALEAPQPVAIATLTEKTTPKEAQLAPVAAAPAPAPEMAAPALAKPSAAEREETILAAASAPGADAEPRLAAELDVPAETFPEEHADETILGAASLTEAETHKQEPAPRSVPEVVAEAFASLARAVAEAPLPEPPATPQQATSTTTWGSASAPASRVITHDDWRRELTNRVDAYRARHAQTQEEGPQNDLPFAPQATGTEAISPEAATQESHVQETPPRTSLRTTARRRPETMEILALQPEFDFASATAEPEDRPQASLVPVADLAERRIAGLMDTAFLTASFLAFLLIFTSFGGKLQWGKMSLTILGLTFLFFYIQYFALFTFFGGATPGMMLRRLRVVSFDGSAPDSRQLLQRSFGYLASACALLLGFLWSLWDEDHLTWHDRMSRTYLTSTPFFEPH